MIKLGIYTSTERFGFSALLQFFLGMGVVAWCFFSLLHNCLIPRTGMDGTEILDFTLAYFFTQQWLLGNRGLDRWMCQEGWISKAIGHAHEGERDETR